MTAHKTVIIECNGCGATTPPGGMIISDLLHLEGGAPDGVIDARHAAAARGWRHTKSGKDLCPDCQSTQRAPVKNGGLLRRMPHWHNGRNGS